MSLTNWRFNDTHYRDVIMGAIASQITSIKIVYSTVYSDVDQRKYQSSASLAFVRRIHRGPVNSPHKGPVTRKMFPFYDVIMDYWCPGSVVFSHFYGATAMASSYKQRMKGSWKSQRWFHHALNRSICWQLSCTCFVMSWSGRQWSKCEVLDLSRATLCLSRKFWHQNLCQFKAIGLEILDR